MPKRMRLNDKSVREPLPVKGRDYQIFDTEVRSFAVCIYRSGSRAFTLDYRYAGRQRRITIGRWPEWTVTAARDRARQLRREIDEGGDPLAGKSELRTAPHVSDMIERYIAEHVVKLAPANAADQKAMLAKLVAPLWGNKLVTAITKTDVAKLLAKIAEGRARPGKGKAQQSCPQVARTKAHACARQPRGRGAAQDVHAGHRLGLARRQPGRRVSPPDRVCARAFSEPAGNRQSGRRTGCSQGSACRRNHPAVHADRGAAGRSAAGAV